MTLPNGDAVTYDYSSHNVHDAWASRVTFVKVENVTVADYSYNGTGHVVRTDYAEPDVMSLAYALGSPNAYGNLDIFNRVKTSQWTADRTTDHHFFDLDIYYDRASNITWVDDTVLGGWDYKYTIDGLNRLTRAERGTSSGGPPPTTLSSLKFDQQWTLDQVGNWDHARLDRNGDTDFIDTGDYDDDRTRNDVNELRGRDTDDNGTDNHNPTYFKTGAMKNDDQHYKYEWDAWGRLRKVRNRGNNNLVTEYRYNGLGFRITETYDTDTSGTVDGSDSVYHFVYDERWRIVATYRDDDANPKEQFVHHAAGAGGYGSSSYIDAVILRDVDLSTDWDAQADALDTRHYYCQNWRADVSVIIDDSAVLVERVMYSPYGVPFGIPVGDIVSSGGEPASGTVGAADINAMSSYLGSSYNIADFDNDGDVDTADETIQSNNNGASIGWFGLSDVHNRLGYAGYVFDEALANTKWHVRHRVLESVLGRWITRDPSEYADGESLYQYASTGPMTHFDPMGLCSDPSVPFGPGGPPDPFYPDPGPLPAEDPSCYCNCISAMYSMPLPPSGLSCPGFPTYPDVFTRIHSICECICWFRANNCNNEWLDTLPSCPCSVVLDPMGNPIVPDPGLWTPTRRYVPQYHPGANFCMRSRPIGFGKSLPGQQCCYDNLGNLITGGCGAGTPDRVAPSGGFWGHLDHDVRPYEACSHAGMVNAYWKVRPPNNGNDCTPNVTNP